MPNDTLIVTIPCDTIALLLAVRRDEEDGVAAVIDRLARSHFVHVPDEREPDPRHESEPISQRPRGKYPYEFLGEEAAADTLGKLLVDVLQWFAYLDADFLEKFSEGQGRTRRFLTRNPKAIYPGREDLSNRTAEVCQEFTPRTKRSGVVRAVITTERGAQAAGAREAEGAATSLSVQFNR